MKRLLLITLLFALMNTGCEDTKDDKLGYSFPKKSKETYYNEAGDITREDNFYWEGNTLTRYYLDNGEETDKNMDEYINAKLNICKNLSEKSIVIYTKKNRYFLRGKSERLRNPRRRQKCAAEGYS